MAVGTGRTRPGRIVGVSPAERARQRLYWPLLLPALLIYLGLFIAPSIYSVWVSLTTWRGQGDEQVFVGLDNYRRLWGDELFRQSFTNTVLLLVLGGVGVFACTFVLSSLLRELRRSRLFLSIVFVPYMLSPIAVGIALSLVLAPEGLVNSGLRVAGLDALARLWLTPGMIFKVIVVGMVWVSTGFYLTLLMSAIGRIPVYYYEQSQLDGAGRFNTFRHVTLPMTWDVVTVAAVLWSINAIKVFEFVYGFVGTGDSPVPQARTLAISQFLVTTGGRIPQYDLGLGSAMGVLMVIMITIFVVALRRLMRREALEF
ncbi:MAG: carbohydrate ABC transporter permease [Propionibacteriaceae bacterium]